MESRSRNRIRHWLVLLMRLLALTCIVLAFAEPRLPAKTGEEKGGQKSISLYLDNSPSMELEGRNGPMFEAARSGALALVESQAATDRFHVVTSDFLSSDRRWLTKDEALERLAEERPGHAAPGIGDVLLHQQEFLSDGQTEQRQAYLFTDLQTSSHTLSGATGGIMDSSMVVRFVTQAVQSQVNVRIDSVWFDTPMRLTGRNEVLHVRIVHDAQRPVDDLPLSLEINGRKAAIGSFRITPGLPTDTVLRFRHDETGPIHAVVRTTDAPVTFDDALFFGYEVEESVDITLIQGRQAGPAEQVALARLFGDASLHTVLPMDASALDYDGLESADLIVIQGVENPSNGLVSALLRNVENGKSLWMIPPAERAGAGWNELLIGLGAHGIGTWIESEETVRLGTLHADHPLFEGVFARSPRRVDLPALRGWYARTRNGSLERNLLSFADGQPFLTTGLKGQGRFHFCASPFDVQWSNLAQHALLVPLALRMAETSRASGLLHFASGDDRSLTLQGRGRSATADLALRPAESDATSRLRLPSAPVPGGMAVTLPLRGAAPGSYVMEALSESGDSAVTVLTLGINPDRSESDLAMWDPEDWKQALVTNGWLRSEVIRSDVEDLVVEVETLEAGQPLWLTLIALALLFLTLEMVLLKRRSASTPSGETVAS